MSCPPASIDYAAEVRSHGDIFMPHADPDAERLAVRSSDGASMRTSALLDDFAAAHDTGLRLLVPAADGLEAVLAQSLGAWKADGSVVLVHPDVEVTGKLRAAERISGGLNPGTEPPARPDLGPDRAGADSPDPSDRRPSGLPSGRWHRAGMGAGAVR